MSVKESAKRLRALMIEKCPILEKHLNPGLSPEECKALAAQYDVTLMQELIDFYGVINGFADKHPLTRWQIGLCYGRWFDTLKESLGHYQEFWYEWQSKEQWLRSHLDFFGNNKHSIPPLRFMGEDSLYFDAADLEGEEQPIWCHSKGEEMSIMYSSLQSMLDELIAEIESGKNYYDAELESWQRMRM
jgi:hypothetical protein